MQVKLTVLLSVHGPSILRSELEIPIELQKDAELVAKNQYEIARFLQKQSQSEGPPLVLHEQYETEKFQSGITSHKNIVAAFPNGLPERYSLLNANQKRVLQRESQTFAVRSGIIPLVHGNFFDDDTDNKKLADKYYQIISTLPDVFVTTRKQRFKLLATEFEREYITLKRAVALANKYGKNHVYVIFGINHKNGFNRVLEHCASDFPDVKINYPIKGGDTEIWQDSHLFNYPYVGSHENHFSG